MTNRFMMSVAAAALIAGSGFAFAQGAGGAGGAGGVQVAALPGAESSGCSAERAGSFGGGSPSAAPMNRDSGGTPGMNTTQSRDGMSRDGEERSPRTA